MGLSADFNKKQQFHGLYLPAILCSLMLSIFCLTSSSAQADNDKVITSPASTKNNAPGNDFSNALLPILINDTLYNQFIAGEKHGPWRTYYPNGMLKKAGDYLKGKKEGLHREWSKDGILFLEGYYKNGKAKGWMKWFHEKGHIAGEGNMIDDLRDGP